jgi:hypothetical protein
VFKKLFGRKDAPKKDGTESLLGKVDGSRWVKTHTLELTNMEGTPTYDLTSQLSLGSEVGDVVISDPSISPRHCTFTIQDEVISLLDHASVSGTLVNGKKIPHGRNIILEESDVIQVGDLEIRIITKNTPVEVEEAPKEEVKGSLAKLKESTQVYIPQSKPGPASDEASKESFFKRFFKKKKDKAPVEKKSDKNAILENLKKNKNKNKGKKSASVSISGHSSTATNSLMRVFAVGADLLLAYSLLIIVSPFDEFRTFVADLPGMLNDLFQMDLAGLWMGVKDDYPILGDIATELQSLFSTVPALGPFVFLFFMVRFLSTLLFGVTISEIGLGIRSHGNMIWKRIGGGLRVFLGLVTGPLLIFDLPAIFSRRTFKEFMTFTHTYLSSKFFAIIGILLYLPLVLAVALFSPLFQGFELPESIYVNDTPEKRVKVNPAQLEKTEGDKIPAESQFLGLSLKYDPAQTNFIPLFKFSAEKKKIVYKTSLGIYDLELKRSVQVELMKSFDLKELLGIGISGNFLLYEKFPEIYNFVYSQENSNKSFKAKNDEKSNRKFADEVLSFTKLSLNLNAENAIEYMETYSPWLKGMMDYRLNLLGLVEYKNVDEINFIKIGNAYFLRFSYLKQKPFDLLIPLIKGQGRIFKVDYDKRENVHNLSSKLYKFILDTTNWFPDYQVTEAAETLNPFQVLDFFSTLKIKNEVMDQAKAQALYGYYFEKSADVLKRSDSSESEVWKKSLESIFLIVEKMKETNKLQVPTEGTEVDEDPRLKLFQKFSELKEAFETNNRNYFQIEVSDSNEEAI